MRWRHLSKVLRSRSGFMPRDTTNALCYASLVSRDNVRSLQMEGKSSNAQQDRRPKKKRPLMMINQTCLSSNLNVLSSANSSSRLSRGKQVMLAKARVLICALYILRMPREASFMQKATCSDPRCSYRLEAIDHNHAAFLSTICFINF